MVLVLQSSMALVQQGSVEFKPGQNPVGELFEEVVSIYDENFGTLESREPYFIKVHRCIHSFAGCLDKYPVAITQKEIEIVVPDINNATKFYKYIVYNHTSCGCNTTKPKLQHKNLVSNEVNETEFKAKLPNNPENLRSCSSSFCSKPQPRLKINPDGINVVQGQRFILYYQCLPGCSATSTSVTMKNQMNWDRYPKVNIAIKTDNVCAPYIKPIPRPSASQKLIMVTPSVRSVNNATYQPTLKTKETHNSESENGLLIYIASPKVFLAALVLSVILVSILIVDFNLCHRKKGIMYSVMICRKDKEDNSCSDCTERQKKVIEIV